MFRKYAAIFRMKYVEMFAYQVATLVWMLSTVVQPLITMVVWMNIYQEQADYFVLYFSALIFVDRMTGAWDIWELDRQIRDGTFSYSIVRPFHPIHWSIAENVLYKGLFLVVMLPLWCVAAYYFPILRLPIGIEQFLLFVLALLLGAAIRFMFSYIFGLLSFWITKVMAVYSLFEVLSFFLSGRIAPLTLLPPAIKQLSLILPFRYMIGFPVDVLTGDVKAAELGYGFLGAGIWLLLFTGLLIWAWHAGMRKNQAVGG